MLTFDSYLNKKETFLQRKFKIKDMKVIFDYATPSPSSFLDNLTKNKNDLLLAR